jgi:hypothetical protein
MTYFADLSDYEYHTFEPPGIKNVGWLASGHEFPKAEPTEELLDKLWAFCSSRPRCTQTRGIHPCPFCSDKGPNVAERNGEQLGLGTAEIRVFSRDGQIYAAPTLIYHYVKSHNYSPPAEFIQALFQGPAPPGEEYFRRIEELDVFVAARLKSYVEAARDQHES